MKAYIKAISFHVPEKRVSNDDVARICDTTDQWIVSHTEIKYRHIANDATAASDLVLPACRAVLEKAGLPSTACILQDRLGAAKAGDMDIGAACTGFIYALETAKNFIKAGSCKNVLVVCSEIMSRITDWSDRNTCVLLGDGAAAALVSVNEENDESEILFSFPGAEGDGAPYLMRLAGGSRHPFHPGKAMKENSYMKMGGQKVYQFAVRVFCDTIRRLLEKSGKSSDDIACSVPHQANIRIIEAAAKRLKISMDKFYINIQEYADTSGATIPIAPAEMDEKKMLKRGDCILTVGFGAGLTYGEI